MEKLTKENVFVQTSGITEATIANSILKEFGENIRKDFFTNSSLDKPQLEFRDNGWILGIADVFKTKITLKQLIELLVNGEIKEENIAVRVDNEWEFNELMKFYYAKSFTWRSGHSALDYNHITQNSCLPFENCFENRAIDLAIKDGYKIISYSDFALQHNLELKPKEVEVNFCSEERPRMAKVDKDKVAFPYSIEWLSSENIEAIYNAMQSLK